jgi:hypothetical protein
MQQSLSNLLAAWLIAAACIGTVALSQETVPDAEATGRVDPASPASVRPMARQSSRDLMFGRTDPEDDTKPVTR